eukprot:4547251-Prymnesium_polylepis.1
MVVAADCTFSVELVPEFLATVQLLLTPGRGQLVLCAVMGGVGAFEATLEQAPRFGLRLVEPEAPPTDATTTAARSVVLRFVHEVTPSNDAALENTMVPATASGG